MTVDPGRAQVDIDAGQSMPPLRQAANFLEGPIIAQMLRLAWPVLVVLALQTLVGVAETYFVSSLGADAVAGVALVFPIMMLMTMMSNGGIGGGVSSAVARAVGAGRKRDAEALAIHAVLLGTVFGATFTFGIWLGGPTIFRWLGGLGDAHANSVRYANFVFLSAAPAWITSLLAAALRGAGNVRVPALVTAIGSVITLVLSPLFIFGWGVVPPMGIAGAGAAIGCLNVGSALALILYMRSSHSAIRLAAAPIDRRLLREILQVGVPSALGTIVASLSVIVTTGLVGVFGRDAIAGYGLASRVDYILVPLLFALGTASVTMVGTNVGAGQFSRARRIAWSGAIVSALVIGAIGLMATLLPQAWIQIFSNAPAVVEAGSAYLVRVAPFYALFGVGMSLYFASQGAGKMAWPFTAAVMRLGVLLAGGLYWVEKSHGSLNGLYWIVAASYFVFGSINTFALASGRGWGERSARATIPESAGRA